MVHALHMKRTNLVVDEVLLEKVKAELGLRTYSDVVNASLREMLRKKTIEKVHSYASSDIWQGSLSEMREDRSVSARHFSVDCPFQLR